MGDEYTAKTEAEKLARYFSDDERFDFVGFIANGSYGSASRVRYQDPITGVCKDVIVKRAFQSESAEEAMRLEREYLRRLRGALHIVQILEVEDFPLNRDPRIPGEWITMEWLSCGTLGNFIIKAKRKVDRLPNRLLWRFFLCLIRACIAMADPPNRDDGRVEREMVRGELPEGGVAHADLHAGNVVLGEPLSDFEHTITPILKVIDFGRVTEWAWLDEIGSPTTSNVWEVGKFMISLITLNEREVVPRVGRGSVLLPDRGMILTTDAVAILPIDPPNARYPLLDPDLGRLICWCLASEITESPSLWDLGNQVGFAVASKQATAYPNRPEETNDHISQLWRRIVFDADT
ncbi:kinase-like domain-containing protein [Daldinia eschscholtzii]|nr:kinase-like domain-containing protein [Daldinia eschscholtzii]